MTSDTSVDLALPAPPLDTYPYDLGAYTLPVRTTSPQAQQWFNHGLNWSYAFHHEEAERCFRYALSHDPTCAMAYWGLAYAGGPNYNKEWERFDAEDLKSTLLKCHVASARATELASDDDEVEKALAEAIAVRFPALRGDDFKHWNAAYADAMGVVYDRFPDDLDVAALYADALMAIAPWALWDLQTGAPREDSQTLRIEGVLEKALKDPKAMKHPGILHFYIHLMELSLHPEKAVVAGDALRGLVPDGGHLGHMDGHISLLIGDYRRCIDSNLDAIKGDEKYMKHGSTTDFYTFYRLHNYTFPIYAAMFNGQLNVALATLDRMDASLTEELMRIPSPPMVDWLEGFKSYRVHVYVRFGMWDAILALPFPEDRAFYCVTTTVLHYARALSFSVKGDTEAALAERELFRTARKNIAPSRFEFPNTWEDILGVAESMVTGELEFRRANYAAAFDSLREAIKRSDNLVYAEPWGWMQPPRHAYAALLLERGEVAMAADVYEEDLGFGGSLPRACQHPNNVWALHGYHECLVRLGRTKEARLLKPSLTLALAVADVDVQASCYCRRVVEGEVLQTAAPVGGGGSCCAKK